MFAAQFRIPVGHKPAELQDTPNGFGRSGIAVWFELLILAESRGSRLAGEGGGSVTKILTDPAHSPAIRLHRWGWIFISYSC
jgi:hypothetical protein